MRRFLAVLREMVQPPAPEERKELDEAMKRNQRATRRVVALSDETIRLIRHAQRRPAHDRG